MQHTNEHKEFLWRAAEHEHQERELGWYVVITLVALLFFVIAIWQKNFLFAVFIVMATGLLFSFGSRKPIVFEFRVNKSGVSINRKLYPYESLLAFSVRDRVGRVDELVIHRRGTTKVHIHIPVDAPTLRQVRPFLAERLPEIEHEETASTIFSDFFGF